MKRKRANLYVIGTVLVVALAGYAFTGLRESLTPYVRFDQARSADRVVQVAGGLVTGSSSYDSDTKSLLFTMEDKESGDTLAVTYQGVKPANFEDAVSIVAVGRYSEETGVFQADNLLVKCPSKYQGLEDEARSYG